jgi:hypothetical protein
MTDVDAFLAAVSGTESNGNYEAYNAKTGARGKYQFIPSTYAMYADDPNDWSPEMQELAAHKMAAEYIQNYGYRNAAIAWQGGEGAIGHEDWSDGNMTTGEYADTVMANMQSYMNGDFIDKAVTPSGAYGSKHPFVMPNDTQQQKVYGFWDEFYNKFMNQFVDQGAVSAVRTGWANFVNRDSMAELGMSDYRPSQEDIALVQKGLEGDSIAQNYVLSNAHNQKTLLELLAMKQEDRARAQAVDNMDYGLSSVGSVLGSILDPTILLAFVPGANLGTIAGLASKVAKVRSLVSLGGKVINESRAAKIAANALTSMAYAGADRFAAQRWGGFNPDYATAMTFSGLLGALGGAIAKSGSGEMTRALDLTKRGLEEETVRVAIGATPRMDAKLHVQDALTKDMMDDFAQEGSDIDLHYAERAERAKKAAAEKAELEREPEVAQEGTALEGNVQFREDAVTPEEIKGDKDVSREVTENKSPGYEPMAPKTVDTARSASTDTAATKSSEAVQALQDATTKAYHDLVEPNSITDTLIKNGQMFILTENKARKWAAHYGITLDPDAKAFSLPGLGVSVLIREKINKRNLTGVVMHEAGVHIALKNMLEPKIYNNVINMVKTRMMHSKDKDWINATRNATSPEEALAYWIENMGNKHKSDNIVKEVRKGIEHWLDPNYDADQWIADTVAGALKQYASKNKDVTNVVNMILDPMMSKKSKLWAAARKATRSTNPEVVFKYWINNNPDKRSTLYKEIKKQAIVQYGRSDLTDKEIKDFALKTYFNPDLYGSDKIIDVDNVHPEDVESNVVKADKTPIYPDTANPARERFDNAQGNLEKLMVRNAHETLHKDDPVQTLPDGSHVIEGITYSKNNSNGEGLAQAIDDIGGIDYSKTTTEKTIFDEVSDKGQSSKYRQSSFGIFSGLGLHTEHSFIGNLYGIMRNSHSRLMQMASNIIFSDPRMEANYTNFLPAASIKQMMLDRWNSQYISFLDKRQQYIRDTFGVFNGLQRNHLIHKVNEQIIDCYNAKARGDILKLKEFSPEIQGLAKDMEDLTADIMHQMQKRSENLGGRRGLGSLLAQTDITNSAKEFFRITDEEKLYEWMGRNYNDLNDVLEDLTEYARRFMDRDAETKYFIELKKREFEAKKKTYKGKTPLQWFDPTEEEIEEHLEQAAKNWAYGRVDKNNSRLNFDLKDTKLANPYTAFSDSLKHRLPIDTSGIMKMKNGTEFSFDKNIRSYDLDNFLPQIMNRLSGEIALRATIGDSKTQQDFYSKIIQELAKNSPIRNGSRELEALQMGLHKILGIGSYNTNEQKLGDAVSNSLRSLSYANVGGNMTYAQLGELGGSIAYGGWKVLANNIPIFGDLAKNIRLGKDGAEIIENVTRKIYAEDIATRGWRTSSSTDSKVYRQLFDKVSAENPKPALNGRAFDAVNRNIKRAALITSSVNFMPKLTNAMVQSMRQAAIEDSLKWAMGNRVKSIIRNPFSKQKLAAASIHTQKDVDNVQKAIKKYLIDEKGNIDHWLDEDPMSFAKWKKLMDNESMRGIQQNSIGNMTPFKEKHRLFFQFKDFTMKAMNQQFMRALSSRERDDAFAALYSYATNSLSYYAMTVAKAYAFYPNDEQKRNEYLERNANIKKVALSGIFRMSMVAPASFVSDGWEVATGEPMFRTTVDNTRNTRAADDSWGKRAADIANQTPVFGMLGKVYEAYQGSKHLMSGDGISRDIDKVIAAFPLGSYLAMSYFGSMLKESANLPEKRSFYTQVQNKGRSKTQKPQKLVSVEPTNKTARLLTSQQKATNKVQSLIDSSK